MRTRVIAFSAIYYIGMIAALLGVLFKEWVNVVPHGIASQIGHNSEGYLAAIIVPAWIQFVRPKLVGKSAEWFLTGVFALAFLALTIVMLNTNWPSQYKTLNESTLAIAILVPYVQFRRPLPRRFAAIATIVLVIATIASVKTWFTTNLAEAVGMVILAVAGLDLIDRGILEPNAVTSTVKRWSWYAFLVIAPIFFGLWEHKWNAGTTGLIGTPVRWIVRINESFIFAIAMNFFFAVLLGRTGSNEAPAVATTPAPDPEPAVLV